MLEGIARAKQDILDRGEEFPVMPVLMHGDAAFAGQGVVAETLNLSQLRGYRTGGTIHIIVNNQVGFTTSPTESRSSMYCTDVARMIQAPIFHVNGDDPEACIRVARLAFAFRQEFNKDVVIDIICYRRRGHNEGDDPSFTQPRMYDLIEKKRSVRKLYTEALIGRGDITVEDAEEVMTRFQQRLESVFKEVRDARLPAKDPYYNRVPAYPSKAAAKHGTAITIEILKKIADAHTTFPDGFTVHPKVMPQLQRRAAAITQGPIDWATGEILAFGSLLMEGRTVRLTGQDSRRGTFVQRFASIVDRKTGESWVPLKHLDDEQGKFHIFDSLLSRVRGDGLRVRLLRGPARGAGPLGGAVRRLRQRRPDDHRRVHRLRPGEVDARSPASRCCFRTATRARVPTTPPAGSSAGCSWPPRTRSRSPSRRRRPATSTCSHPRAGRAAPSAGDLDAEVDAAEQAAVSQPSDFTEDVAAGASVMPRSRIAAR